MKKIYLLMYFFALTIYVCQKIPISLPSFINNYANDLLCTPIVMSIIAFVIKKIKKEPTFTISIYLIALVVIYYSVYFEWYLPGRNARYTADYIDVALYITGGFIYYFIEKTPKQIQKKA